MAENESKGHGCTILIIAAIIVYIGTYELSTGIDKYGTLGDVALGIIIFVLIIAIIFAQYLLKK